MTDPGSASSDLRLADRVWSAVRLDNPTPRTRPPGLPLPHLERAQRDGSTYYAVSAMDRWGRLADRSPLSELNWAPGLPLRTSLTQGAIVVVPDGDSPRTLTRQGHLRVPATLRHLLRLKAGDRILLAAFLEHGFLIAYPMAALDAMLLAHHTSHIEGASQ